MFHSIQVGARLPAHATVLGRLLLSDLDINALRHLYPEEPLPAYTVRTPTTLAQLKGLIDEDRTRGYAVSQGGFETGISTIAAPVFNDRNEVVACVSITVPAQRVQEGELDALINQVREAAAELTERISHTPHRGQWLNKPSDKKAA
jgi:DNA-binding IclR family transcriptional regulator